MEPIKNLEKYNNGMRKSLIDKIFFVDKVPSEFSLLDFGCADGTLIEFLSNIFPQNRYVGYDFDPKMIELANERNITSEVSFTSDFQHALSSMMQNGDEPKTAKILNLSSIIHEVYSYSSYEEVEDFWNNKVFSPRDSKFDYIVIRDMIPSSTVNRETYANDVRKIFKFANHNTLNSFQNRWGSIKNLKNLMHFLLKYRYVENWDREVRENYLPITLEDLYMIIPNSYDIIYQEHYILPFLHEKIKVDFDIDFYEPTHLKLILRKK